MVNALTTSNIYCIWYPSGGFGYYINAIISQYGDGFARPSNRLEFSSNGNSHSLKSVAPVYFHDPVQYNFEFSSDINYSVLIDNGIENEGTKFKEVFPKANIIKICYSDFSWPVVAQTMIVKAMNKPIDQELSVDPNKWDSGEDWVKREKYFLFLRDHHFRRAWKPDQISTALMIEDLLDYQTLRQVLGINLNDFSEVHRNWWEKNSQYYQPVLTAKKILSGTFVPVTDIWTQAVVYYQIWCKYGIEVPHSDYSNWFKNYQDIVTMLSKHGVKIDSN